MSRKIRRKLTPGAERLEDRKLLFSFGATIAPALVYQPPATSSGAIVGPNDRLAHQDLLLGGPDTGQALLARSRPTESI